MEVGILTYHNTRNCGALLQAYALQSVLKDLSVDNEIIDYRCKQIEDVYEIRKFYENKNLKSFVKWLLSIHKDKIAQKKIDEFKYKYLRISKTYDKSNIAYSNSEYNAFITGSDQVWNMALNGNDSTYLLDFVENSKKRIAYAASMGSVQLTDKNKGLFLENLPNFDCISVRENSLKTFLEESFGVNSTLVLDPTLLLKKENYKFDCNLKNNGKYIFVYTIAPTPHIYKAAKYLAQKTGCKIIWGHMSHKRKKGAINKNNISPEEFIEYIKNAQYVLTSSFHGMALSIIFEKQFFYDLDTNKNNNNSRLISLSEKLFLKHRQLSANNVRFHDNIDYVLVNKELEKYKIQSLDFLKRQFQKTD